MITKEMIVYLRYLADGGLPQYVNEALCYNFLHKFEISVGRLISMSVYKSWPKWSGNVIFPIGDNFCESLDKFTENHDNYWADNNYCNDRREWCAHLATYFQKVMTSQESL